MTTFKATITLIKRNGKNNITHSVSNDRKSGEFGSFNFTGRLTELRGFRTSDGKDVTSELLEADVPATACVGNFQAGTGVVDQCHAIFAQRFESGDKNPALSITFSATSLDVTQKGNIIIKNIVPNSIKVNKDVQLAARSSNILGNLKKASIGVQAAQLAQSQIENSPIAKFVKQYF